MTTKARTFEDVARLHATMTRDDAQRWCANREISAEEGFRLFTAANGNEDVAQDLWENDDTWTDETNGTAGDDD